MLGIRKGERKEKFKEKKGFVKEARVDRGEVEKVGMRGGAVERGADKKRRNDRRQRREVR